MERSERTDLGELLSRVEHGKEQKTNLRDAGLPQKFHLPGTIFIHCNPRLHMEKNNNYAMYN